MNIRITYEKLSERALTRRFPIRRCALVNIRSLDIKEYGSPQSAFNRMKFAPIVLARLFWFHCPTIEPNFSVTMKNYPRSPDRVWHVRLQPFIHDFHFSSDASSPTGRFYIRFFILLSDLPIRRAMGRRLTITIKYYITILYHCNCICLPVYFVIYFLLSIFPVLPCIFIYIDKDHHYYCHYHYYLVSNKDFFIYVVDKKLLGKTIITGLYRYLVIRYYEINKIFRWCAGNALNVI